MSFPPELLALGVILIFGGLFYLMIRALRQETRDKTERARRLGFQPLETAPPELIQRVEDLFQNRGKRNLEIRNLYQRSEFGSTLYLFDLVDTAGDDTWLASDSIGIISRSLALPRFSLTTFPEFDRDRGLGKLMDGLLDKVLDLAASHQDLIRIEFPEVPGFDDRFVVFGRDEHAVRSLVSRVSWESLVQGKTPLQVQGSGDFLSLEHSYTTSSKDKSRQLEHLYQAAIDLLRRLEI